MAPLGNEIYGMSNTSLIYKNIHEYTRHPLDVNETLFNIKQQQKKI
jgi:hypothetical protein